MTEEQAKYIPQHPEPRVTMLERVARSIWEQQRWALPGRSGQPMTPAWEDVGQPTQRHVIASARAAVEAMRSIPEPIAKAATMIGWELRGAELHEDDVRNFAWEPIIDAILSEDQT